MMVLLRLALITALLTAASAEAAVKLKRESLRKHAPDFELRDESGKLVRLSDFQGRVVLLDFWATWCVPCKAAIPWLNELQTKYREAGLEVIGVSMDEGGWEVVKPFADKMRIGYPVVIGTKRVAYLYGEVKNLPIAFFVDRQHRVAAIHVGAASRREFESAIKLLLAK